MSSIHARLLTLFGTLSILGAAAFVVVSLYGVAPLGVEGVESLEYRRAIQATEAAAEKETRAFGRWFAERRLELRLLAEATSLTSIAGAASAGGAIPRSSVAAASRRLQAIYGANYPAYLDLFAADPRSGQVLASATDMAAGLPGHIRSLVAASLGPGIDEVVELLEDAGEPSVLIARQIRGTDARGAPGGRGPTVLVARLSLRVPMQLDQLSLEQALGKSAAMLLINTRQRVIAASGRSAPGTDFAPVAALAQPGAEGVQVLRGPDGAESIVAFRHLHVGAAEGLTFAAVRSADAVHDAVRAAILRLVGLGAVGLALGLVLVAFAARRVAQAQSQLGASRRLLEAVIDAIPMTIFAKDLSSRYIMVNRHMAEFFGMSKEDMLRRHTSQIPNPESVVEAVLRDDAWVFEHRRTLEQPDIVNLRHDGTPVHVHSAKIPLLDDSGAMVGLLGVSRDITDQRRAEAEQREAQRQILEMNESLERVVAGRTEELSRTNEELKAALEHLKSSQDALLQSEKLAALGRLVAGVAHELNTPIGNSLLSASTLAHHTEDFVRESARGDLRRSALQAFVAQSKEAAGILVRNLEKAAELIRSFKQVAADQTSSQRRGFALKEVVDEVLLAHRPMLKKSPIRIEVDVLEGIRLDSYPGPLGQVLGNLIANAVLHGYEGAAGGTVTILARPAGEDHVEIAVIDEGRGIPEGDLKRIFDPFFTTRLGRGGTGLGLGICHSIVTEALGGSIRVRSRPGEGASFILRIPLRAPYSLQDQEAA